MKKATIRTSKGFVRDKNEDCVVVNNLLFKDEINTVLYSEEFNYLAILDGMGGEKYGELASSYGGDFSLMNYEKMMKYKSLEEINQFIINCNQYISNKLCNLEQSRFSGTTIAGVLFLKNYIYVFNVGDSRVYFVYENNPVEQISYDDSLANYLFSKNIIKRSDIEKMPYNKNIIFNALGNEHFNEEKIHTFVYNTKEMKDKLKYIFICSDGVSDFVKLSDLKRCFKYRKLSHIAQKLEDYIFKLKSKDNYSYIIAEI